MYQVMPKELLGAKNQLVSRELVNAKRVSQYRKNWFVSSTDWAKLVRWWQKYLTWCLTALLDTKLLD